MSRPARRLVFVLAIVLAVVAVLLIAKPVPTGAEMKAHAAETKQEGGRSGFWTSRSPAKGWPYKWRLLGIGILLVEGAGGLILFLTTRASGERGGRQRIGERA